MAIIDIVLLLCYIPAIISGIHKGFINQVVKLISLVVGALLAFHFAEPLELWLASFITLDGVILKIIAFILVIALVSVVLMLLGNLLTKFLKAISLNWVNRILGFVFSIIKTTLLLGFIIMLLEGLVSNIELFTEDAIANFENAPVYQTIKNISSGFSPVIKDFIASVNG